MGHKFLKKSGYEAVVAAIDEFDREEVISIKFKHDNFPSLEEIKEHLEQRYHKGVEFNILSVRVQEDNMYKLVEAFRNYSHRLESFSVHTPLKQAGERLIEEVVDKLPIKPLRVQIDIPKSQGLYILVEFLDESFFELSLYVQCDQVFGILNNRRTMQSTLDNIIAILKYNYNI